MTEPTLFLGCCPLRDGLMAIVLMEAISMCVDVAFGVVVSAYYSPSVGVLTLALDSVGVGALVLLLRSVASGDRQQTLLYLGWKTVCLGFYLIALTGFSCVLYVVYSGGHLSENERLFLHKPSHQHLVLGLSWFMAIKSMLAFCFGIPTIVFVIRVGRYYVQKVQPSWCQIEITRSPKPPFVYGTNDVYDHERTPSGPPPYVKEY